MGRGWPLNTHPSHLCCHAEFVRSTSKAIGVSGEAPNSEAMEPRRGWRAIQPTAEGHLPWPVRRCGTLCLTIWEILLLAASDARWKRFCLRRTETCSAFGVLRECAVYKFTFTYLLTQKTPHHMFVLCQMVYRPEMLIEAKCLRPRPWPRPSLTGRVRGQS